MLQTDLAPDRTAKDAHFTTLMENYGTDVLRMCCFLLKDRTLAEDAAQDVFLKAYRRLDQFPQAEKNYLMTIAVNTCRDIRRSAYLRRIDRRVSLDDLPPPSCEFSVADDSILQEVLQLKSAYREVIMLRYYQGMEPEDCARALGLTRSGFYKRLNRALAQLKPKLERWVFGD